MKRRRVVVAAFLLLGLLAVAALVVASRPFVRARWHLSHVSSREVTFGRDAAMRFSGHARAFLDNPARKDLLPYLTSLAEREADSDTGTIFRALYLEAALPLRVRWGQSGYDREHGRRVDDLGAALLVHTLATHDPALRNATIRRLPLEARFNAPVRQSLFVSPQTPESYDAVIVWIIDFIRAKRAREQTAH